MVFGETNTGTLNVGGQGQSFVWTASEFAGGGYVWVVLTEPAASGYVRVWGLQFGSTGQSGHGMEAMGAPNTVGYVPSVIEITPTPRT